MTPRSLAGRVAPFAVELLYRYTSNSRFMTGVSPGLADFLPLFGKGKGSAEQEMLAAIDEYFETPGSGYIRLAQRRFPSLRYNNALINHHVWGFRDLVRSADKLTSVSLEATSSPVPEGTSTPVTVRLYKALGHDATIPLTETSTSYVKLPKSVVVPAGALSATATLETTADGQVPDGCASNGHVWVFGASTTDLGLAIRVRDTVTGEVRDYRNEPGAPAGAITDLQAFGNACSQE